MTTDPLDTWTEPTEIKHVTYTGSLTYSCCGLNQTVQGDQRSYVTCERCHTSYGLTLLLSIISPDDYKFPRGTQVKLRESYTALAGSTRVLLGEAEIYTAAHDTHGVLNVPPGFQPIVVSVQGDRCMRDLLAFVPEDLLEKITS